MGAIKNYMMELAEKLGKDFEELTQEDFEKSMTLNMGQLLSIPFIIAGIVILVLSLKNKFIIRHQDTKAQS